MVYGINLESAVHQYIPHELWHKIRDHKKGDITLTIPFGDDKNARDNAGQFLIALAASLPEIPLSESEMASYVNDRVVMGEFPGFPTRRHLMNFVEMFRDKTDIDVSYDPKKGEVDLVLTPPLTNRLLEMESLVERDIAAANITTLQHGPLTEGEKSQAIVTATYVLSEEGTAVNKESMADMMIWHMRHVLQDRHQRMRPRLHDLKLYARDIHLTKMELNRACRPQCEAIIDRYVASMHDDKAMALQQFASEYEDLISDQIRRHILHHTYSSGVSTRER